MADYDNITSTQNTLWNSDESGQIAYSEQIKDAKISWTSSDKKYNGSYPDPKDPTKSIPYIPDYDPEHPGVFSKTEDNKFQSKLNEFFLNHWADWQKFLHDEGVQPGVIDSWKEVQDFLDGLGDTSALTLQQMMAQIQAASGQLNIALSEDYPGSLEVTTSSEFITTNSYLDPQTGEIKIIYNFD